VHLPIAQVVEQLDKINEQRPPGRAPVGVLYRVGLESTSGKRLTVDEIAARTVQCREAGFEGVIVETNFCREIESTDDWLGLLDSLTPILDAAAA
jgi:hypothetical protein